MHNLDKSLFRKFCYFMFSEYQLEIWRYEGRYAPLTRFKYIRQNYSFLKREFEKNKHEWYMREVK